MSEVRGSDLMSDFNFTSKYARYIPEAQRRETFEESVDRMVNMHLEKYDSVLENFRMAKEDFFNAFDLVKEKKLLASQRALQFGGPGVLKHNMRSYNCSTTYIDRLRAFAEIEYLLLCGAGVGFSVQKHHVEKLPLLVSPSIDTFSQERTYKAEDSIEGWAEAFHVLISSYHLGNEHSGCHYHFDLSDIRPQGAPLSTGGKAPGPEPLRLALERVRKVLHKAWSNGLVQTRLSPLQCHDIICHMSDSVLAGGVRRSALISVFSFDDEEMMNAKTGDWYISNSQRARANNSAILLRNSTTKKDFLKLYNFTKEFGEPGFIFADTLESLFNPCQPAWATVLTPDGVRTIGEIKVGDLIWSSEGWTKVVKKWSTGVKDVYEYRTSSGAFYGTETHRVVSSGEKVEAKYADSIDALVGPQEKKRDSLSSQDIIDGIVLGDGTWHKANGTLVYLNIGEDDQDYFTSPEVKDFIGEAYGSDKTFKIRTLITNEEVPAVWNRRIPKRYFESEQKLRGFLRGLYTANGSICGTRVTLKTSSLQLVKDVQLALSSVGISSYYTTNKATDVEFVNGTYTCKQSYDVNITSDRDWFASQIGFIQKYKTEKLNAIIETSKRKGTRKVTYDINSSEYVSTEEVFDITVDNESHTYWTGGVNVSNCAEINLYPVLIRDPEGEIADSYTLDMLNDQDKYKALGWTYESGVAVCNLCEINGAAIESEKDFAKVVEAAAIIGTLQAGYSDPGYLTEASKYIIEREALLGISITGMMDNPKFCFDEELLCDMAELATTINKDWARILEIRPAARVTCVKPAGNTTIVLGCQGSGIHPPHSERLIRRIQTNKFDPVYQEFKLYNPHMCEESVWSASQSDDVISFPVVTNKGAITKDGITAIEFLEKVKLVQNSWVSGGTARPMSVEGASHNVSNTVVVGPDEWDLVADFIWNNRDSFSGVSLLAKSGDFVYEQAPMQKIWFERELIEKFGKANVGAAKHVRRFLDSEFGHVRHIMAYLKRVLDGEDTRDIFSVDRAFKGPNWTGEQLLAKHRSDKLWEAYSRVRQLIHLEDPDDIITLLASVTHEEEWNRLTRDMVPVDYSLMVEADDNTKAAENLACYGGACLV